MLLFKKGDIVHLRAYHSKPGKGLSYDENKVIASEDGTSGGWDVYDGTCYGQEVSFYGFSVFGLYQN